MTRSSQPGAVDGDAGPRPYLNPYLAGVGLGVSLLLAFVLVGRGLGASGAVTRATVTAVDVVAPSHAENNSYYKRYVAGDQRPLDDFLVYQMLGMILGGVLSAVTARRMMRETSRGPRISRGGRMALAVAGGVLAGFGARMAGGCTSGLALTGGATLALSGWIFMFTFFGAGFVGAALVRRQWQ
jgi:uncharacterized membrane protein YedE/YeeE